VLLLVLVVVSLATRAVLLGVDVIDIDEASYAVGAAEILRGRPLYVAFADHHPPGAYLYYALCQLALGPSVTAVHVLTALVTLPLTALAAAAFFGYDRRGWAAGLAYLLYGAAFFGHDMLAANCEVLMLLPAAWAVVLLRDESQAAAPARACGAGMLLAAAVLVKYQAGLWLPALAFASASASRTRGARWASLASLAAGFGLPLLATYAYFAATGRGTDFLYWNLLHNLRYTANPLSGVELGTRVLRALLPFLLATAGLWWSWRRSAPELSRHQRLLVASLVWLSLFAATLGLRFYPHYFIQLYLPLALGAAPLLARVVRRPLEGSGRWFVGYSAVLVVGFTVANAILYYGDTNVYEETRPVFARTAARLRSDPCYGRGSLFVWGYAPLFYYEAGLPLASRFVFPEETLVGYVPGNTASATGGVDARDRVRAQHWDWLLADLEASRPTFILDTAPARIHRWHNYPLESFPRLAAFVSAGYERTDEVGGVRIFRRRGCASGGE
jgi:hypothetical protein